MKYQIFGQKSGLRVSTLALGTGNFGTAWPFGASKEDSKLVFDRYAEAGGNFIDTADGYQAGQSESFLGDFLTSERDNFVLASKYSMGTRDMQTTGNSRKTMMRAVEESLKRLKTDRLDLYWVHLSDGQTPTEEIVRGLDDLVSAGKINYAGFSNFPAWRIANAALLADLRGWAPIIGIQVEYNLIERTADRELLPMAEALGLGVAFWSPLAGGTLTGKYRKETDPNSRKALAGGFLVKDSKNERETRILDLLESIAAETGNQVIDVALAWIRQKHDQSTLSTITVIGSRNVSQLDANLSSLELTLTKDQISHLNEASQIELGSPHEVIAASQGMLFGGSTGQIEIKHSVA
ncbi:aldo/keto reductase [Mucilaginibacter sp. SG564]|uniref:aldo/keto reductase n=1 Tax=Mucilaginibacter sp. SG564 TaxID=2587022 RepID=UPI0015535AB1|nr:aldo/keto reductase [Mucilaginibacter sp. SG564]NOW94967.1 aryl-alcohol dehydrogenase-like predicted oxidoreductase [Mucilaginibacter sp. SG564]